jgi:CheY-like chemotaxis protein
VPAPVAAPAEAEEPPRDKEIKAAIAAMRRCAQAFAKNPDDASQLNEFHCHAHALAEDARVSGLVALHRLCAALSDFTHGLYRSPSRATEFTAPTLDHTLDFLAAAVKERALPRLIDPSSALIYSVDDDVDNCDCIRMTMEASMLRTQFAHEPAVALAELAATPCDLLLLDVNLPGMTGFELCQHIRQLPLHATTPIIFLTGLPTPENRNNCARSGGNDLVGKPFNLDELNVKALTHILKGSLHAVA